MMRLATVRHPLLLQRSVIAYSDKMRQYSCTSVMLKATNAQTSDERGNSTVAATAELPDASQSRGPSTANAKYLNEGSPYEKSQQTSSSSSPSQPGVLEALWGEFRKLGAVAAFEASSVGRVMLGTDGESPAAVERERRHKEAVREKLAAQQHRAREAYNAKLAAMPSWKERLAAQLADAKEAFKQTTSKKSGVTALIQHCAASHAAEVAVEQGIDVKDVQIVLEKQTDAAGGIAESKVVGYIEAPMATEEEVAVFARKLTKACPAAAAYDGHIEWRRRGERPTSTSPENDGDTRSSQSADERTDLPLQQSEGRQPAAVADDRSHFSPKHRRSRDPSTSTDEKKKKPFDGFRL
ncbi:Hypothetical protein, putative [Bodo saltans]|uniref:Uncharacterized protein n=1 Tax=Bodo saltans TaxID=75058 RepID=A0A0S4JQL6_BODSA|nr:Hypothetical protein, putative [Bodo saltans]|eukprot:CUG93808.1 Hypothetical protein, putative [Bodo saltans]